MMYCKKCQRLYESTVCPLCGSARRSSAPTEGEPVRILSLPFFEAAMVEPLLEEAGILYYVMGGGAAGLGAQSSLRDIMVPYGYHTKAKECILDVFGEDSEIGRALPACEPDAPGEDPAE